MTKRGTRERTKDRRGASWRGRGSWGRVSRGRGVRVGREGATGSHGRVRGKREKRKEKREKRKEKREKERCLGKEKQ